MTMKTSLQIAMCAAMTMDGRLAPDDLRKIRLGSDRDLQFLRRLRDNFDASLMGGQTFRTWPLPPFRGNPKSYLQFVITQKGLKDVLINLDRKKWGSNKLVLIYKNSSIYDEELPLCLERGIECVFIESLCPKQYIQKLSTQYDIQSILLEGGGRFCHPFFQQNLIQDIYLTIVPMVMGGQQAQGFCIGQELLEFQRYSIKELSSNNHEIFVHYHRIKT